VQLLREQGDRRFPPVDAAHGRDARLARGSARADRGRPLGPRAPRVLRSGRGVPEEGERGPRRLVRLTPIDQPLPVFAKCSSTGAVSRCGPNSTLNVAFPSLPLGCSWIRSCFATSLFFSCCIGASIVGPVYWAMTNASSFRRRASLGSRNASTNS